MKIQILLCLFFMHLYGIAGNQFTIDKGLSNNNIECILQDADGFLWVGTWNGLNRYDGYSFEKFYTEEYKPSLPNNWITQLFQDSQGNIWVGTISGLGFYNKRSNTFETHKDIQFHYISGIVEDTHSNIWISSSVGLYIINSKTKQLQTFISKEKQLLFTDLEELKIDNKGYVWAGCRQGILKIDAHTQIIKKHISLDWVKTIAFDTKGNIWCGTRTNGLVRIDTTTLQKKIFKHNPEQSNSIGSDNIWSIFIDKKHAVWIACQNGFLNKYDTKRDVFIKKHDTRINNYTNEFKSITCMYEDKEGNIWLGFHRAGLYCIPKQTNTFEFYKSAMYANKKVDFSNVSSFAQHNEVLLFGSDGDGLFVYNTKTKDIDVFGQEKKILSNNIISLYTHGNMIWVATWGGGLSKIDLQNNYTIKNYSFQENNPASIPINNIKGILYIDSLMWVGTHGDGIALFNSKTQKFFHSQNPHSKISFNYKEPLWINHIDKDSKGNIWISTFYGLYKYNTTSGLQHYYFDQEDSTSISDNKVYAVYEDAAKQLWIITGNGINTFDNRTNTFTNISKKLRLPTTPRGIIQDNAGVLWISYERGIVLYDTKTNKRIHYSNESIGVEGECIQNAIYKTTDGCIYIGTTAGFVRCYPHAIENTLHALPLFLRNLFVNFNKIQDTLLYGPHISQATRLSFPYSKDVITIELASIVLSRLHEISYSYRMLGYDTTWIHLDKNRNITFSGLSPGTYILEMRGEKHGSIISEKELEIKIIPKWWMTWWFKLCIILIIIALVYLYSYIRNRKQKQLNQFLQKKIKERTKELSIQKEKLEEQYAIISKKNEDLQIANDTKNKLFSIISHDMKNPLNAMLGLSQILIEGFKSFSEQEKMNILQNIVDATKSLTNLTLNLLNWSVVQTDSIKPSIASYDLQLLIQETIELEIEIAKAKHITVTSKCLHSHYALVDKIMINTVIRNILHNALKFTPQYGSISISTEKNNNYICIEIKDSGVGMNQIQIDSILHSKYLKSTYGTNYEKGTGLGLGIAIEFILKNNGTFDISSEVDKGTVFKIQVPKGLPIDTIQEVPKETVHNNLSIHSTIQKDEDIVLCIVEDNEHVLSVIQSIFNQYYTTHTASDGNKGFELIVNQVPDIIITDIEMPQLNGIEMIQKLRKHPITNHIPIVILSSKDSDIEQIEGYQSGADDYVTKPFNHEILLNKVQAIIEQRKRFLQHYKIQSHTPQQKELAVSYDEKFLKNAINHIENNYKQEGFSVEDLAQHMAISRVQLYRKFKTIIGITPQDFIKNYRLEKAALLLKTKKWRVADVAYEVGFNEPHYFTSCFVKHYGITPSKYIDQQ
ncbi:MAG TPA: two-component regulator propeller domain-containing protein [Bacteroidales bacterium]|nr:two-component regulator propeller domain-containing protein [Bacteroidales bacterium]